MGEGGGQKPHQRSRTRAALWCQQAYPCITPYYEMTEFGGSDVIAGTPCDLWLYEQGVAGHAAHDEVRFCVVRDSGALISVNRTYILNINPYQDLALRNTFEHLSAPDPAKFDVHSNSSCCDLRPLEDAPVGGPHFGVQVNDAERIRVANAEATGGWVARASPVWQGVTIEDASKRLGTEMRAFTLPLPSAAHTLGRSRTRGGAVPDSFDSRVEWGARCPRVRAVRNQGGCGSCWAFSAAETLSDRFCVAKLQQDPSSSEYTNLTLSPEFLMDCDTNDQGCGGGLLDDAWLFMQKTGLATEKCDPYAHCANPANPQCSVPSPPPSCTYKNDTDYHNVTGGDSAIARFGCDNPTRCCGFCEDRLGCQVSVFNQGICTLKAAKDAAGGSISRSGATCCTPVTPAKPPPPPPPPPTCLKVCKNGNALSLHKAKSGYAVSMPGDVASMQREIMTHGPIQVAFQVFSDFMFYHNGTYFRTKSAQGPHGGHAVKIVGWGVDASGVDYWIVANSWSPEWGAWFAKHLWGEGGVLGAQNANRRPRKRISRQPEPRVLLVGGAGSAVSSISAGARTSAALR